MSYLDLLFFVFLHFLNFVGLLLQVDVTINIFVVKKHFFPCFNDLFYEESHVINAPKFNGQMFLVFLLVES